MKASELIARRSNVLNLMKQNGVSAVVTSPGADSFYLGGIHLEPSVRPALLVLREEGTVCLIAPELSRTELSEAVADAALDEVIWWSDSTGSEQAVERVLGKASSIAVNPDMPASLLLRLQQMTQPISVVTTATTVGRARQIKTAYEVEQMSIAASAIDAVHRQVPEVLTAGVSEYEVARRLRDLMIDVGHQSAEFAIVATGANAAEPHHQPDATKIKPGELVVVDIGGKLASGYHSDMTRMYVVGEPRPNQQRAVEYVIEAQQLAFEKVQQGVRFKEIDDSGRAKLAQGGYEELFIHRIGHGIGLEVHEPPYLGAEPDGELQESMTFSIEPGVYLPGEYGVRIEDIVLVTVDGPLRLNSLAHALRIL